MGNAGTAMRLMMGLLAPQNFDSTLVGDGSLMRRPMERVAVPLRLMGAQHRHRGRPAAGAHPRRARAARDRLRAAGGQRAGEVGDPAGGPGRRRPHAHHRARALARSHRAHARRLRRGGAARRCATIAIAGRARRCAARRWQCRGISPRRRSSSWPAAWRPGSRCSLPMSASTPRAPASSSMLQRMGADIRVHTRAPAAAGAEPVADIEVRASALRGITVPEALVPLAIDEFPVFFVAAACAEGETLVRGAHELRVKESDRLAAMAAGLERAGVEHQLLPDGLWLRGARQLRRRHVSTAAATTASPWPSRSQRSRRARPSRSDDVANVATSFPGFVATRPCQRLADPAAVTEPAQPMNQASPPVVTIDGPSGSGKGTISRARRPAHRLAPAGQRRALPPRGPGRAARGGLARMTRNAMPGSPGAMQVVFGSAPGRGRAGAARRGRT